jgi:Uncharacterised protein conserved in bacteria (DUF2336)
MTDARERLTRLIELASENAPEKQPALAFELCDLLVAWPERYPQIMREPFEALLEKVLRRLDETTRRLIATRLSGHSETAVTLLNEFYFDVPTKARGVILERNHETVDETSQGADAEEEARLVEAARRMGAVEFVSAFAAFLHVPTATARSILDDRTGDALAVACRGAGAQRATYSSLVLFAAGNTADIGAETLYARLAAFDNVPEKGARRMLAYWRRGHNPPRSDANAA